MESFAVKYRDRYVQCLVDDTIVVIITRWPSAKKANDHFKRIKDRAKKKGEITHFGEKKIAIKNLKEKFKPLRKILRTRTIMGKAFREEILEEDKE